MYTPPFDRIDDESHIRAFVKDARTAWLVVVDQDGVPTATLLPILWRGDKVVAHMAIANNQWRAIDPARPVLLIVSGDEAYISPSWYAAKAEHGKVVPTWNYSAVHLTGAAVVHQDPEWVRAAVTDLTERHESARAHPWHVTDAPEQYVAGQLRGIVGIEIAVTKVEGKAKLSQNRSEADQRGVIEGLQGEEFPDAAGVARAMSARRTTD